MPSGDPATARQALRELEPAAGPVAKVVGMVLFAAIWNGIVSVFVWQAWKGWQGANPDWFLTIFLIPFVLVGVFAFGLVGYFVWAFLSINENTEVWSRLSPFHHYLGSDPLVNGMRWGHAALLAGLTTGLIALAVLSYERRDLRQN